MTGATLRIGVLGAAKIVPAALLKPARAVAGVEVTAIAARDRARAEAFAGKNGISKVHAGYDDLLADDAIDAVYIPLPNGLHGHWTIKALEAGRHVLCEKPFTANAGEARAVKEVADRTRLVVMEGFHWRHHPLAARMLEVVGSGELGAIRRVEAEMSFPLLRKSNIRWQPALAGGAMMDAGCYPVSIVRTLAGAEPVVVSATSKLRAPGVDRVTAAELRFEDGRTGHVVASMLSARALAFSATVIGEDATMHVLNPVAPQFFHRLTVRGPKSRRREHLKAGATYTYQLEAFRAAVRDGGPNLWPPAESVANMQVIDDIYRAAGLEPRAPTGR
jgi:predicted dehydrogenase